MAEIQMKFLPEAVCSRFLPEAVCSSSTCSSLVFQFQVFSKDALNSDQDLHETTDVIDISS